MAVRNPATGALVGEVPDLGREGALEALERADGAAPAWAAASARARSDVLMGAFELMRQRRAELAGLIVSENGKSEADALAEVSYAAEYFRWYAEEGVRVRGQVFASPTGSNQALVSHEPVGTCLLVTPWNFPAAMATRKIGPALAAGCTALLKPAPDTPLTALAVADLLQEAGLPDGVLAVLPTTRAAEVVAALLEDERVRMLSFTGSTAVGRQLLAQCADRVVRTAMELGGNAPFLVFDDADPDAALEGLLLAKLRNTGQACTAANRCYLQRGVPAEWVDRVVAQMASLRVGDPSRPGVDLGPLINDAAVAKVQALVDDAKAVGARVVLGGAALEGPGSFYPPTVLLDVPPQARIMHEEVFGPVLPIARFDDEDEAVALANATEHGLVSYVFTEDLARGLRVSRRLQAGMVGLNRGLVSDPAAPFGGVKQSGLGREGSHEGIHEYLETKYVAARW
ncbi:NAD-dependent succinate-semialdehyde dehydrogenase [Desertihabitans brevis]|nr:NAD-dependent succinate-semialdehyde dehydrogenase [Desertihabitans brevis]